MGKNNLNMAKITFYRNRMKVSSRPRRPFEKERLRDELRLVATYGLRNKRELYRVDALLCKIRKAARILLTLPLTDSRRIFQGKALLRRMLGYGLLDEHNRQLDYILALKTQDFLERRLQTLVYTLGLARSVHHARTLIRQRHIIVGGHSVNSPGFLVRTINQKTVDFCRNSALGGGKPGRVKLRRLNGSNN